MPITTQDDEEMCEFFEIDFGAAALMFSGLSYEEAHRQIVEEMREDALNIIHD